MQDACAPRRTRRNACQLAKDFRFRYYGQHEKQAMMNCVGRHAVLLVLLGALSACSRQPALRLTVSRDKAVVSVSTLGEYPTTILRAILTERQTGRIVWEIRAESGTPQIHDIVFSAGKNPVHLAEPDHGKYIVVAPPGAVEFQIDRGRDYEVEIWKDMTSRPARASFRF